LGAVVAIAHARAIAAKVMQADIRRLVDARGARRGPAIHEVAGDLGLAIDRDALAGQRLKIDAVPGAGKAELRPVMDEALVVPARAEPELIDEVHRALLEH